MNVLRTKNVKKYHLGPKVLVFQKKLLQKCFYRVATFNLKFWQNLKISDHHVAKSLKFILGFEIFEKSYYELWTIPFSPKLWYFLTVFKPLCNFSGFHCFHFQYELFWPFPFKSPQLLPCRIQSRRPKFWTKFWTKFPKLGSVWTKLWTKFWTDIKN